MPEPEDSDLTTESQPTKRLSSLFKLIKISPQNSIKSIKHDVDEGDTRNKLQKDMQDNWTELPATLRRKLKNRESVLAEFTSDDCEHVKLPTRTVSTDSLLSSASSSTSSDLPLPPPPEEEEHDSGTDVHHPGGSIVSSDDEQQKERAVEECVRQDALQVINFTDDGAYEDVTPLQVIKVDESFNNQLESIQVEFVTSPKETVIAEIHYSQVQVKDKNIIKKDDTLKKITKEETTPNKITTARPEETITNKITVKKEETPTKFQQELVEKLSQRSLNFKGSESSSNGSTAGRLSVQQLFQLANELSNEDPAQDGTEDTLKDIQETLLRLEEKVRQYESRLEVAHKEQVSTEQKTTQQQQRSGHGGHGRENTGYIGPAEQDGWTRGAHVAQYPMVAVPPPAENHAVQHTGRMGETGRSNSLVHDGRHSLLQFAMLHFRQSPEKFEMLKTADGSISGSLKVIENIKNKKSKKKSKDSDWTWKEQVDMVKFSPEPPKESLLRLDPPELSELAVECFTGIMRYMGDLPMPPDVTEVKCVYTILMHCHKHEGLRDEVYCQIMKQTTNNKSQQPDSCQRGWRLFSILAAYFVCTDTLKPYLFKYLETAAYDKRRAYHGTATVCLHNLRKTFKYGGRKNVPSVEEITAISAGRNSKRQIYRLPGGTERVINTKSTTVVQDIIEEICGVIGVRSPPETEEFSLYCIVEGDAFTMPLAREEYVLDVTTELHKNQQVFYLIFCRSVWYYSMRLDSPLYVEVVFNQVAPDYLEGLLLVMPGEQLDQEFVYDIAKVASLLHRAADMGHVPAMKETKFLLPRPALAVRDIKPPQWVNMVQASWQEVEGLTTVQAKAQVLDILQKWPLFGSSFFAVKRVSDPKERSDHILALNRQGVHFLDLVTHETLMHYPFSEVISTRKVKTEDGTLFLDMKCGNLMQQRITRLQTDQAHEISRLIRQYITMEQRQRGGSSMTHDNPADISLNPR